MLTFDELATRLFSYRSLMLGLKVNSVSAAGFFARVAAKLVVRLLRCRDRYYSVADTGLPLEVIF